MKFECDLHFIRKDEQTEIAKGHFHLLSYLQRRIRLYTFLITNDKSEQQLGKKRQQEKYVGIVKIKTLHYKNRIKKFNKITCSHYENKYKKWLQ